MQDIIIFAIDQVKQGSQFKVNFKKKQLIIDDKPIIDNGKYNNHQFLIPTTELDTMEVLESLYNSFKHSIPSERSNNKRKSYFKALMLDDLSPYDMVYGELREIAQLKLELTLLCFIINEQFVWPSDPNKWFIQGTDKDLILLKNWF